LWSEEVARVFEKGATLKAPVRRALRATLYALAEDASTDAATRADVFAMLSITGLARSDFVDQ
jgi:hypothetical protein